MDRTYAVVAAIVLAGAGGTLAYAQTTCSGTLDVTRAHMNRFPDTPEEYFNLTEGVYNELPGVGQTMINETVENGNSDRLLPNEGANETIVSLREESRSRMDAVRPFQWRSEYVAYGFLATSRSVPTPAYCL